MKTPVRLSPSFVVVILLLGCSGTTKDAMSVASAQPADNHEHYATPQVCFEAMWEARNQKDFARYVSCLSARVQNQQVGWLAFQLQQEAANNPKKQNQILEIYDKHNLKRINVMDLLQIHDSPGGKGVGYALDLVGSRVKDKAAFFAEADAVFSDKEKPTTPPQKPRLADVKIEHETAVAKVDGRGEETSVTYFRRINDSWVIADAEEVAPTTREGDSKAAINPTRKVRPPQQESELDKRFRASRIRCEEARQLGEAGTTSIPALVKLLKDQDGDVRATAVSALGRIGPAARSAVPSLNEALNDQYSEVRSNVASALVQIVPQEKSTITVITRLLRDADKSVRIAAGRAAVTIGPTFGPTLLDLLKDKDANVRADVAGALAQLRLDASTTVPAFVELLRDPDADVRRVAVWSLAGVGPAAIPTLIDLLKDKDGKVRSSAAFALERIVGEWPNTRSGPQAKKTIAALTDSLKDSNAGARANAAMALGYIGAEAAVAIPALVDALKDKDAHVRSNAAYALGQMGVNAGASVSSIANLLRDTDFEVRRSAKEALAKLGETAIPTLVGLLRDENHEVRVRAVEVLEMMGPTAKAAFPKLTELLSGKAADVRWAAEEALEKIKAEKNKAYGSMPEPPPRS